MSGQKYPVGQQFIDARNQMGLSREDVLSVLRIRESLLDIMEKDHYPNRVIDVFLKGHLSTYAKFLKINPQTILNQLESKGYDFPEPLATKDRKKQVKRKNYSFTMIVIGFCLVLLFLSREPQEETRVIAKPYYQEY